MPPQAPQHGKAQRRYGSAEFSSSPTRERAPKHGTFTSNFAPSLEERMRPVKTPPGPPPGAYDVQPKWNKVGTHVMAPLMGHKKREERTPGYVFESSLFSTNAFHST